MKSLVLFAWLSTLSTLSWAYPISPRPLRKLVMESDYIVRGFVIKVNEVKTKGKNYDPWDRDVATIVVRDVWQGKIKSDTINVYFTSGMICPAPGVFFENEEVLTFLDKREKAPGYEVHALSYGVKHGLTDDEFLIYKNRVQEMQVFIRAGKENNTEVITPWLVECAVEKCTRWDGVYELTPQSHFMSYYENDQCSRKDIFMNPSQIKRLFNVFISIDTIGRSDLGLADILAGVDDDKLFNYLKNQLVQLPKDNYYMAGYIIEKINPLSDSQISDLYKELQKVLYSYEEKETKKRNQLIEQYIERIKNSKLKQRLIATGSNNI